MRLHRLTGRCLPVMLVLAVALLSAGSIVKEEPLVEAEPMEAVLADAGAVDGMTWDLTMTRNDRVEDWIDFLKGRNADRTRLWLERSGRYESFIHEQLEARGMPRDLLYLALIESGFSPRAHSSASAVGLWQFIAETGRRYGLEVTDEVDERRDPIRATDAALDYLQDLYDRFGSWYLAAAAYNTGENRVDRILRERAGGARGSDSLFWTIAPYLPRETRNYVPLMLAAGYVAKQPVRYGFDAVDYQDPLAFETVWVPEAVSLRSVARAAGVDSAVVADLNPQLILGRTPEDRGWTVRIPPGRRARFRRDFPAIYREARQRLAASGARAAGIEHRMQSGETLSHLAVRYGVSVAAIRRANDGIRPERVRAGQLLAIPGAAAGVASAGRYHRVRPGENLTVLAQRYSVSISQLRSWNDLSRRGLIRIGQRLRIGE